MNNIKGMTLGELKIRIDIGMESLDSEEVKELLSYAAEMEVELIDFEDLKDEKEKLRDSVESMQQEIEDLEDAAASYIEEKENLKDIIENALETIKTMNLPDDSVIDALILDLERGMK